MNLVAMIPARSGSKGLPNKNIKNLLGKPILSYSLISALKSEKINSVYLNSDSDEYLDLGKKLGAKTYKRPVELGDDNTSMKAVLSDFSKYLINKKEKFDAILVLYPTNPLRTTKFINEFIDQFNLSGGDLPFISVRKPSTHPFLCYKRKNNGTLEKLLHFDENKFYRRQQYPDYYRLAGGNAIIPIRFIDEINAQLFCNISYSYIIPDDIPYVDVDTIADFKYAEYLLSTTSNY